MSANKNNKHQQKPEQTESVLERIVDNQNAGSVQQGHQLSESELARLVQYATNKELNQKQQLLDRLENKRGVLSFWYLKMPMRVLNVRSIADNQRFIHDTLRTIRSPQCPVCNQGLMMHDLNEVPMNGKVRWFCSNEAECDFDIMAEPSSNVMGMAGIENALAIAAPQIGRAKWQALTEEEKEELIEAHLLRAITYRNFLVVLFVIYFAELVLNLWWAAIMMLGFLALTGLLSVKWAYRAWQVKTGNLFTQKSMFFHWLKSARHYYSIDWVDEQDDGDNKK